MDHDRTTPTSAHDDAANRLLLQPPAARAPGYLSTDSSAAPAVLISPTDSPLTHTVAPGVSGIAGAATTAAAAAAITTTALTVDTAAGAPVSSTPTPFALPSAAALPVRRDFTVDNSDNASVYSSRSRHSSGGLLRRNTDPGMLAAGTTSSPYARQGSHDYHKSDDEDASGASPRFSSRDDVAVLQPDAFGVDVPHDSYDGVAASVEDQEEPVMFGIRPQPDFAPQAPHKDEIRSAPGDWRKLDLRLRLNQWRLFGNIIHFVLTAWWVALLYLLVGVLMYVTIIGRPYAHVAFRFARYFFWPFGKYIELLPEPYDPARAKLGFQAAAGPSEDSGYYPQITLDDAQTVSRVGQGEDSVHEYLVGGRGVRFTKPTKSTPPDALAAQFIWTVLITLILGPVHLLTAGLCWFSVGFIPMARIYYTVGKLLILKPLHLRVGTLASEMSGELVVCTYRAFAKHYFSDKFDGMNIVFVNLLPFVLFALFDGYILPIVYDGHVGLASPGVTFGVSLVSIVPLVYYVGMGVACVSAQSSMAIAAVVNATFGSIVEIVLYMLAVAANKGHTACLFYPVALGILVIGSIIGSLFGTLLFLPGLAMIAGGLKIKEQRFNARAQGVSSTLVLMSVVLCLTPTAFYRVYGPCEGCSYSQNNPAEDPFYQDHVLPLIYFTTVMLPVTYAIGLYFSLKTHSDRIYRQAALSATKSQVDASSVIELPIDDGHSFVLNDVSHAGGRRSQENMDLEGSLTGSGSHRAGAASPAGFPGPAGVVDGAPEDTMTAAQAAGLKVGLSTTESEAARNQDRTGPHTLESSISAVALDELRRTMPRRLSRMGSTGNLRELKPSGHGSDSGHGHQPPPWSRRKALFILITSTVLFALLAEILVNSVDVVLEGSPITEKFIGITLFALVPSATEYVNAILFAMRNNISLSMEISSQYTVQVTMLQVPVLAIFSFIYNEFLTVPITNQNSFILIFNSFDVFTCLMALALMLFVYTGGRTDYFKGCILSFVYLLFVAGYWMVPAMEE